MIKDVKAVNRRETLYLTGALTVLAGAALWTKAHAEDKPAEGTGEPAEPNTDENEGDEAKGTEIDELSATDLVGYELRVVKPGQMVTQEYNPGRVTVVVDAKNQITQLYIG